MLPLCFLNTDHRTHALLQDSGEKVKINVDIKLFSPCTKRPVFHPVCSLVLVLVLLTIRQGGAGADLAVSVQPLLHHLGDQGVVAAAGALLHGHQHASFSHAAVQPFPQQLLLLLLVSILRSRQAFGTLLLQAGAHLPQCVLLTRGVLGKPTGL